MAIKLLFFDYRPTEKAFFEQNEFENFDIVFFEESLNDETVAKISQNLKDEVSVISVFIDSNVNSEIINQFKNLRIISTRSTGYDHICQKTCVDKNISLINVENYGSTSVAQYIIGLMLALIRNIIPANKYVKNSENRSCSDFIGRDLSTLTLGVIGTGSIGASVCKFANAFGMKIIAYDINPKQELMDKYGVEYLSLDKLFKQSDIMSLHVPYTGNNRYMIAKEQFALMKPSAYIINTARGELLNIQNLYEALINKQIKGVALDVITCESVTFQCDKLSKKLEKVPFDCVEEVLVIKKLAKLENVIITPHIAYQTTDSILYILQTTFDGIRDCIQGGKMYRVL